MRHSGNKRTTQTERKSYDALEIHDSHSRRIPEFRCTTSGYVSICRHTAHVGRGDGHLDGNPVNQELEAVSIQEYSLVASGRRAFGIASSRAIARSCSCVGESM